MDDTRTITARTISAATRSTPGTYPIASRPLARRTTSVLICGASRPESRSVRYISHVVANYRPQIAAIFCACQTRCSFSRPGPNVRLPVASVCRRHSSFSCTSVSGDRIWLRMFTIAVVCGTAVAACIIAPVTEYMEMSLFGGPSDKSAPAPTR